MRIQIKQLWGDPGELLETQVIDVETGERVEGIDRMEISLHLETGEQTAKLFRKNKPANACLTVLPVMEAEIEECFPPEEEEEA